MNQKMIVNKCNVMNKCIWFVVFFNCLALDCYCMLLLMYFSFPTILSYSFHYALSHHTLQILSLPLSTILFGIDSLCCSDCFADNDDFELMDNFTVTDFLSAYCSH